MGILETGRLMMVQELIINSAREGARLAALGGSTVGTNTSTGSYEVNYCVRQSLAGAQIPASAATITITDLDNSTITDLPQSNTGDRIQVTVSVPFKQVAWSSPWFFGNATLTGSSIMRKEAP
jgi:Flp pilus assembly protein TadG